MTIFSEAIDVIIQQKPDVLVHGGNLFDVIKPKTLTNTTVLKALDRLPGSRSLTLGPGPGK
jgi:DNA repair exonuclease SbcCD nuclease subunit